MREHRRRIATYLRLWREYDNSNLLACAAIIARHRDELEFFTWAICWLMRRGDE